VSLIALKTAHPIHAKMQASSPVVAGIGPAVQLGMPRSRIAPTLLAVALAHAVLIAVFVSAKREPAPRAVQSTAIVAQLLSPPSDTASVATQPAPVQPPKPAHSEPARAREKTPPPAARQSSRTAAPAVAPRAVAAPTPAPSPAPTASQVTQATQAPASAQPAAGQAATATAAASASSAAPPNAHETIATAAPKSVPHADCRIVKPSYPELSRRREETGTAAVRFVIGTTGAIEAISLVKSSGFPRLDEAAVAALRQSTCQPYVENGAPVRASYTQAFTFGLDDD
jgi:protein TonB